MPSRGKLFLAVVNVLAVVNTALVKIVLDLEDLPAKEMTSLGEVPKTADDKSRYAEISPVSQEVFASAGLGDSFNHEVYLAESMEKYECITSSIDKSIRNHSLVYYEDSEVDDHWQSGMSAQRGLAPMAIYLRGGLFRLRQENTNLVWKIYRDKFSVHPPKIMTLHGETEKNHLAQFDLVEGAGAFNEAEKTELINMSLDEEALKKEIAASEAEFLEFLEAQEFTTIALKTAPTGLAKIISQVKDYKNRVAVIWTGPFVSKGDGSFLAKFNFSQDPEAGDELLLLGVPIIVVGPATSDSDMNAIVDYEYMEVHNAHMRWKSKFEGFKGLKDVVPRKDAVISTIFDTTSGAFVKERMKFAKRKGEVLNVKKRAIELAKDQLTNPNASNLQGELEIFKQELDTARKEMLTGASHLLVEKKEALEHAITLLQNLDFSDSKAQLANYDSQLSQIDDEFESHVKHGKNWEKLHNSLPEGSHYREYCPVDQFIELMINPEMRKQSVKEVIAVTLQRDRTKGDKVLSAKLSKDANVYIPSKIDSKLLTNSIQDFINWLLAGEPTQQRSAF